MCRIILYLEHLYIQKFRKQRSATYLRAQVLLLSVLALCRVPGASRSGLTRPSLVGLCEEEDARL